MPLQLKHKLCFIHIPKAAGTTIEKALSISREEELFFLDKYKNYPVCPQHLTLAEIAQETDNLMDYSIFTVVRNPYDRLVSEFHHYTDNWFARKYHGLDFDQFVEVCLALPEQIRRYSFDGHLELQTSYIKAPFPVKIFRYEQLHKCFDWLKEKTGEELNFGHERKSVERRDFSSYYQNLDTLTRVNDFYQKDFIFLDYPRMA